MNKLIGPRIAACSYLCLCALAMNFSSCSRGFKVTDLLAFGSPSSKITDASQSVYTSCDAPSSARDGRAYYADPVNGLMSNDGSQAHPWAGLSAVLANGKLQTVVRGGDVIYLLNGNHGTAVISGVYNTGFVTIMNAAGSVPTLTSLTINGGSHFVISGLKFEYLNSHAGFNTALAVASDTGGHASDNIVVSNNTFQSQNDVSGWTIMDWQNLALFSGVRAGGSCLAINSNTFRNLKFGVGVSGSKILVRGNAIDHFSGDGVDFTQGSGPGTLSEVEISNNRITNSLNIGDGNHDDGIQGYVLNGTTGRSSRAKLAKRIKLRRHCSSPLYSST